MKIISYRWPYKAEFQGKTLIAYSPKRPNSCKGCHLEFNLSFDECYKLAELLEGMPTCASMKAIKHPTASNYIWLAEEKIQGISQNQENPKSSQASQSPKT